MFFGRITRNLAIDRYRRNRAQKHGGGEYPLCLEEIGECIGEKNPVEDRYELKCLLDTFLSGLSGKDRSVFLLRYWYCTPVSKIAFMYDMTEGAVKMNLYRTRNKLRDYLTREGVGI